MDRYEIDEYLRECSERAQERDLLEIERGDEARLWPDEDAQPSNHQVPVHCIVMGHSFPSSAGYCMHCGQPIVWDVQAKRSREVEL